MTMPTFVGGASNETGSSTTTTYDVDFSTVAILDGDVVLVAVCTDANTVTYDTSYSAVTWTQLVNVPTIGSRGGAVFARVWHTGDEKHFWYRKNKANSDGISAAVYRGVDFANMILGTGKLRAGAPADTTTQTTTLSVTTTAPDTLVVSVLLEATSAAETSPFNTGPTMASGWTKDFYRAQNLNINTETFAHKDMPTAGASGNATFTFQQVQATNSWGIQIALPAPSATPVLGLAGVYVDASGISHNGYLFYNDASNVRHPVALPTVKYKPYTVSQMLKATPKGPWLAMHRGASYSYPEETLDGYRGCAQRGAQILEISVQYSSDGTPWCFHDPSMDRTVLGTAGNTLPIASTTDAVIATKSNLGSTAAGNPTQRSRPVAKLVDVIAAYKDTHVLIVEDKTYTHTTSFLALLNSYGTVGRPANEIFVVKIDATGGVTVPNAAAAAGFKTWGYIFDPTMAASYATALTRGFTMIGLDFNSSDATLTSAITSAKAAGVMPTGHIVASRTIRDRLLGLGMQGIMMSNIDAISH